MEGVIMKTSDRGIASIRAKESIRLTAYQCTGGVWTIGWGNTFYEDGRPVKKGDTISRQRADELFLHKLSEFEGHIKTLVLDKGVKLEQYEFDALVSFIYNIGPGQFSTSTLLKHLLKNDKKRAAAQFQRFNISGGKYTVGLQNRRVEETEMFLGVGYET